MMAEMRVVRMDEMTVGMMDERMVLKMVV
jgi:hypothetical protein